MLSTFCKIGSSTTFHKIKSIGPSKLLDIIRHNFKVKPVTVDMSNQLVSKHDKNGIIDKNKIKNSNIAVKSDTVVNISNKINSKQLKNKNVEISKQSKNRKRQLENPIDPPPKRKKLNNGKSNTKK